MIKTVAGIAGMSMAFSAALPASAVTIAELQAQIASLMAQLASLQGTTNTSYTFTQNLTVGSTGADVTSLQQFLVGGGYLNMPIGVSYGYFGSLTKAAVASWQAANGVSPAVGYWGPLSRAKANSMGSIVVGTPGTTTGGTTTGTTTGGSVALAGGEGSLDINSDLGDVEDELMEGDSDEKVLGAELEAEDSDIMITRVDVEISTADADTGESSRLDSYITDVSLWLDGTKLAELDVDEGDEDTDIYTFRFSGLSGVIREGDTADLYVKVSAVGNVDSDDVAVNLVVDIEEDGIRAIDAAGLSETYATEDEITAQDFSVVEVSAGDLDITEADSNPDAMTVQIDEDNDTNDVLVLAFELEADNQDLVIDAIPVGLTTNEDVGVDGPVRSAVLKMNGTTISTKSIAATTLTSYEVLFDNLDIDLDEGDTAEFKVYVNLNDADETTFASSTTLYATTTGSDANWDVEDSAGDDVTPDGSVTGGVLTFMTDGVSADLTSSSAVAVTNIESTSTDDQGQYTMTFTVSAFEEPAWIELEAGSSTSANTENFGLAFYVENASTGAQVNDDGATTAVLSRVSGGTLDGNFVKINAGSSATFTLTAYYNAAVTGIYRVQMDSIGYNQSSATVANAEYNMTPAEDFESASVQVQN